MTLVSWLMNHTPPLNQQRQKWEQQRYSVLTEGQNSFTFRGSTHAGRQAGPRSQAPGPNNRHRRQDWPAHATQVLIYMYALPRGLERYRGLIIAGQVAYPDHVVDIPTEAVDASFVENLGGLIRRLASQMPARRPHPPSGVADAGQAGAQPGGLPVLRDHAGRLPREGGQGPSEGGTTADF